MNKKKIKVIQLYTYLLGEKIIGANAKVAMPCLYTTKTVGVNPSNRAALVKMASNA